MTLRHDVISCDTNNCILASFTAEEQCSYTKIEVYKGSCGTGIFQTLQKNCRDQAISRAVGFRWIAQFKEGRICSCYKPPKQNDFLQFFESVLSKINMDLEWVILGDFNICFRDKKKTTLFRNYEEILSILNLKQLIHDFTKITVLSSTVLDHILCSQEEKISQSGIIPVGISDHFPVFCTRKLNRVKFHKHNNVKIRCMKNY